MVMIDCGATENFIDQRYAEQNHIPLQWKAIPRRVLAVDRREVANGPVTHDALVDLTINNHYETIRLHCITIGSAPIIIALPCLRKHNPNIDGREGHVTFNLTRCAKECLTTSPHATTVSKEKSTGEYYRDTAWSAASQDTVYSISMVDAETFEEELEDGIEGTTTLEYIDEVLGVCEVYHADMRTTEPWRQELMEEPMAGDIVPKEYHKYLHVFEAKDNQGLLPHRHHDHQIPLLE
jgi:hypothetical protein